MLAQVCIIQTPVKLPDLPVAGFYVIENNFLQKPDTVTMYA